MKEREYVDGCLTTNEVITDYVLIYADGRTEDLSYVPIMGPGDVLVTRARVVTTTFGAWELARSGSTVGDDLAAPATAALAVVG